MQIPLAIRAYLTSIMPEGRTRKLLSSIGGFGIVLLLSLLCSQSNFVVELNLKFHDFQVELSRKFFPSKVAIDPIIVGIDDDFVDSIDEPLTLSHIHLANLLRSISGAGAKVIGIDIALPEKRFETVVSNRDTSPDAENDFHRILLQGLLQTIPQSKVVVVKVLDQKSHRYSEMQLDLAAVLNLQGDQNDPIASAHLCTDIDGKIRQYPGSSCQPDKSSHSLSSEIAAAAGKREDWSGMINYRLGGQFDYISAKNILLISKEKNGEEQLRKLFDGKVVLLGSTQDYVDLLDLPVKLAKWLPGSSFVPGVLIHAQMLRGMLNQGLLKSTPNYLILLVSLLASCLWFVQGIKRKLALYVVFALLMGLSCGLLLQQNIWFAPGAALISGLIAVIVRSGLQSWQHFIDKQRLSRAFTGRVSPSVMQEIISGDAESGNVSRRISVCVLFSDVRNFTTMCEHMQAEEVVSLLNRYFALMVSVIHRQGGTVDKFMGDGLMAFFGAPNALPCPEKNALDAACEMIAVLEQFNQELVSEGRSKWAIGVGLHTGEAIIGYLGSAERNEYTAIGDVVNTAARLEGLSKELAHPIVCSDEVAKALSFPQYLVNQGERQVKGRSAICVYTMDGVQSA
jgi:adenylate cyclase